MRGMSALREAVAATLSLAAPHAMRLHLGSHLLLSLQATLQQHSIGVPGAQQHEEGRIPMQMGAHVSQVRSLSNPTAGASATEGEVQGRQGVPAGGWCASAKFIGREVQTERWTCTRLLKAEHGSRVSAADMEESQAEINQWTAGAAGSCK